MIFAGEQLMNKATRTGVTFISAIVIIVAALAFIGSGGLPRNVTSTTVTGASGSIASTCDQPTYLLRLASQVEQTPQFISQSHGLSYVFEYGNNESAETGTADVGGVEEPIYYPANTNLGFYSYGTNVQTGDCYNAAGQTARIVGALWVAVPINPNGSYVMANTSVYFTPGLFSNGTSVASLGQANSTGSGDISCVCQPTYSFATGSSTTMIAASTQNPSLLTGQFTVDTNSSIPVRLGLLDAYNGTLTVPTGTNVTITIGTQSFVLQPGTDPFTTPNPLITLPDGATVIHYTVSIPRDSPPGSYEFEMWMASFSNATATFMTYSDAYSVALIVQ